MRRLVLFICMLFAAIPVIAQTSGTIDCGPGDSIPLYEIPESLVVLRQISCGRIVGILGSESGYTKIQVNDNLVGFIKSQYMLASQNQSSTNSRIAELESLVDKMKKQIESDSPQKSTPLPPQQSPRSAANPTSFNTEELYGDKEFARVDVFGGFSLLRPNLPGNLIKNDAGSSELAEKAGQFILGNILGWNSGVTININDFVGVTASVNGFYRSFNADYRGDSGDLNGNLHAFLFGPCFSVRTGKIKPFARVLVGFGRIGASIKADIGNNYYSADTHKTGFAAAIGGGIDVPIGQSISLRPIEMDYFPYRQGNGTVFTFNNIRWGSGLVYHIR